MICATRLRQSATAARPLAGTAPTAARAHACLARFAALLALLSSAALATPDSARFAEPTTGRPVSQYTVELAVNRGQRQSFAIPRECPKVNRLYEERHADTARVVDRYLWDKVSEDCWFHAFLNRHPYRGVEDFVSDYDFKNARLADLPIDRDCIGDARDGQAPGCGPTQTGRHGLLSHFPLSEPVSRADDDAIPADCLLRDGLFFGQLYIGPDGMRCASRNGQPSLRLIAVDYADINGDGYLDAVLRFVPIGPGAARSPLILPLTRTSPGGPFKTPETPSVAP